MLNQVVLVGRIVKTPELRTTETGKKTATVTLAVPRNYKNMNGEYETDFLDCTLWTNVAENTTEYCQSGDMVGINFLYYAYLYVMISVFFSLLYTIFSNNSCEISNLICLSVFLSDNILYATSHF